MTFSYNETKDLVEWVLIAKKSEVRRILHERLGDMKRGEPEFYAGIIKHGPSLSLTPEQWFDLLSKLTTRVLRDNSNLMNKLSAVQKEKLPPATFG